MYLTRPFHFGYQSNNHQILQVTESFFTMEFSKRRIAIMFIILFNLLVNLTVADFVSDYVQQRNRLIQDEDQRAFGGALKLAGDEVLANKCLMHHKKKELDDAFKNPSSFLPANNFLEVKSKIEATPVFKIIQMAPKGGDLHSHSSAIASAEFILQKMTYEPHLYICLDKKLIQFRFFKTPDNTCNWKLLSDYRKHDPHIDARIKSELVLAFIRSKDVNDVWDRFEHLFVVVKGLVTYKPLFEKYLIEAMDELNADHAMFLEIRAIIPRVYDLDQTVIDPVAVAKIYKKVNDEYVQSHPNFLGIRIIFSLPKSVTNEVLVQKIEEYKKIKAAVPDIMVGFDLIGQEDRLSAFVSHSKELIGLAKEATPLFLHAGETNWYGHNADDNLYDAILLNTKRIGHGYALPKHPKLMEIVKQRKIAVEICPISNQVLSLVDDMRNHPASVLFAEGLPVVVTNDDPGFWGVKGLSYDFYEAFVGMMSSRADLRALKQLALNSIEYSGLSKQDIVKGKHIFQGQWKKFVNDLIHSPLCTMVH